MTFALRAVLAVSLALVAMPSLGRTAELPPQQPAHLADPCEGAPTQLDAYGCYRDSADKSRAEVERAFERSLRTATRLDADARRRHMPRSMLAAQLRASQAAWRSYSKAQCALEGGASFGGSGTDVLEAACRYRLNAQRLAELKAADELLKR
jgi:uncharacterized protein YecT (DUF1311 family)